LSTPFLQNTVSLGNPSVLCRRMDVEKLPQLRANAKPVAMVADAIRDCSNRNGVILDPFGGAGTTLIAAERTGRRARLIEIDPLFVEVTIERWQRLTGGTALHADSGQRFVRSGSTVATVDKLAPSAAVGR
jgi:DNA methylase